MKWIFAAGLLFLSLGLQAVESTKSTPVKMAPAPEPKMTTKDAKINCKEQGKTGPDLIQCMKDKKEIK